MPGVLERLQALLGRIYDVEPPLQVHPFLVTDPAVVAGWEATTVPGTDEMLFVHQAEDGLELALYVDQSVLQRLESLDPFDHLGKENLADCCTAVEGVSHLLYVAWSAVHGREVSLLELETQAEVDKFAAALVLSSRHGQVEPEALFDSLFNKVSFSSGLDAERLARYAAANRFAARFCQRLSRRWLRNPDGERGLFRDLRAFYRLSHTQKIACAAH